MVALRRTLVPLALLPLLTGCAALQQIAALHRVTFTYSGVSDVRLAGVPLGAGATFRSFGATQVARLGAAIVSGQVPLEMIAHLDATNPQENSVSARLVALDWTLFIESRRALAGGLARPVTIGPGHTSDVPLAVRLDLLDLANGSARDLFELGLAIAGYGSTQKDLRLELTPTIDTSIGPIRYPSPLVVHRAGH